MGLDDTMMKNFSGLMKNVDTTLREYNRYHTAIESN